MASRAAAFTAEDARNGFGFRSLDGIEFLRFLFRLSPNYKYHIQTFFVRLSEVLLRTTVMHRRIVLTYLTM